MAMCDNGCPVPSLDVSISSPDHALGYVNIQYHVQKKQMSGWDNKAGKHQPTTSVYVESDPYQCYTSLQLVRDILEVKHA
jgi:hypothetical protein